MDVDGTDIVDMVSEPDKEGDPGSDWEVVDDGLGLEPGSELDLCFICDCTGSMGPYIKATQQNIIAIVDKICKEHGAGVRFGLISYRDHPPQDRSYVTKCFPFTDKQSEMSQYVNTMKACGGGDGPEALTAGLYEALQLPWRPNATKVCVLVTDAPPHGIEPQEDGFPNGDPDGRDPLEIAREMVLHGITVYTVGCEPALGRYQFARDFLCTLAEITSGQAVALSSAALLADVIINGSAEELSLAKLQRKVEKEVLKVQTNAREAGKDVSVTEAVKVACGVLQAGGVRSKQMRTDGHMVHATPTYWGSTNGDLEDRKTLAEVKADLCSAFGAERPEPEVKMGHRPSAVSTGTESSGTASTPSQSLGLRDYFVERAAAAERAAATAAKETVAVPAAAAPSTASATPTSTPTSLSSFRDFCVARSAAAAPRPPLGKSSLDRADSAALSFSLRAGASCRAFEDVALGAAPPRTAWATWAGTTPAQAVRAASSNVIESDLINEAQVERIVRKARYQSRLL